MSTQVSNFNYPVNGLRGLCILMVFIYHIENSGFFYEYSDSYLRYLVSTFKYGVEIFFMISGYVIINSIRRKPNIRSFFIDRVLRIYPTWVPLHVITFFITPIVGKIILPTHMDVFQWAGYFFSALLLLPPVIPLPLFHPAAWSLSYEWCFYFVVGGLFFCIRRASLVAFMIPIAILFILFFLNLFPRALFFLPGVLVALFELKVKRSSRFLAFPLISFFVFLVSWKMTGAGPAQASVRMTEWIADGRIFFAGIALVAATHLFAAIVTGRSFFTRLLTARLMQFFGKISYSFYLWSTLAFFPAKIAATNFIAPYLGYFPALLFFIISAFLVSLIISWLNWYYIEVKLGIYLRKKFSHD